MKNKRGKVRLRKWVKVVLNILSVLAVSGIFFLLLGMISNRYNDIYEACDSAKGHMCDYYEARQYAIRGE